MDDSHPETFATSSPNEHRVHERHHVGGPDRVGLSTVQAMRLQLGRNRVRVHLAQVVFAKPLELGTEVAAGAEAHVLWRLDEKDGHVDARYAAHETLSGRRVEVP